MKPNVQKKDKVLVYLILVVIALLPRMFFFFNQLLSVDGLPQTNDTAWYIEHANLLINNFNIDIDFNGIFYLSFYSLIAVLLLIFKSQSLIVLLQLIVNALTVILIYKLCLEFTTRRVSFIAGVLYSFLWPVIYWSIFIITDSLFISLLVLQAYLAVKVSKYRQKRDFCYLAIVSIYMIFFRPTGLISLGFVVLYLLLNFNFISFIKAHKKGFIITVMGFVIISISIIKEVYDHALAGSLLRNMWWLLDENYSKGMIYDISTKYDYVFHAKKPAYLENFFVFKYFFYNFKDIMILYGKRIVSFLGVWVWKIDELDLLSRLKYIIPFSCAFISIVVGYWQFKVKKTLKVASVTLFMIASIVFFTVFFFMDSAYRYRAPALVFAVIPLAQGLDYFIYIFSNIAKKLFGRKDNII